MARRRSASDGTAPVAAGAAGGECSDVGLSPAGGGSSSFEGAFSVGGEVALLAGVSEQPVPDTVTSLSVAAPALPPPLLQRLAPYEGGVPRRYVSADDTGGGGTTNGGGGGVPQPPPLAEDGGLLAAAAKAATRELNTMSGPVRLWAAATALGQERAQADKDVTAAAAAAAWVAARPEPIPARALASLNRLGRGSARAHAAPRAAGAGALGAALVGVGDVGDDDLPFDDDRGRGDGDAAAAPGAQGSRGALPSVADLHHARKAAAVGRCGGSGKWVA